VVDAMIKLVGNSQDVSVQRRVGSDSVD
jgi:hypothetical protein